MRPTSTCSASSSNSTAPAGYGTSYVTGKYLIDELIKQRGDQLGNDFTRAASSTSSTPPASSPCPSSSGNSPAAANLFDRLQEASQAFELCFSSANTRSFGGARHSRLPIATDRPRARGLPSRSPGRARSIGRHSSQTCASQRAYASNRYGQPQNSSKRRRSQTTGSNGANRRSTSSAARLRGAHRRANTRSVPSRRVPSLARARARLSRVAATAAPRTATARRHTTATARAAARICARPHPPGHPRDRAEEPLIGWSAASHAA